MREIELAIAMSARDWPDAIRRFLADHGGARVRVAAMGPEDLVAESYDVLLVDDICSFLTPWLVEQVAARGRSVIGVYDAAEFADGRQRLLECGVHGVVEAAAHPDEFLDVIAGATSRAAVAHDGRAEGGTAGSPAGTGTRVIAVGGPPGGVGSTEVAIAVAARLAARAPTVLVDADELAPSLAQRLGLPLHPNLRTAVDVLEHRSGSVAGTLHDVDGTRLSVLAGLVAAGDWLEVRGRQLLDLIAELGVHHPHVVVDMGGGMSRAGADHQGMTRAVAASAERLLAVGVGTPVGACRLLEWVAGVSVLRDGQPVDVLVNRAPADSFRRGELLEELTRTYRPASFAFLPEDGRVVEAAWEGTPAARGRFRRSVDRWVDQFLEAVA